MTEITDQSRKTENGKMDSPWQKLAGLFDRRSVAFQLAVIVAVTALPLLLGVLLLFNQLIATQRETVRETLTVAARGLVSLVDNELETHAAIAASLAASKSLKSGDLSSFRAEAEEALKFLPGSWLVVTDTSNQMILNTLKQDGAPLPKHAAPDIIARGFSERRFQVADLTFGPVSQQLVSYIEMPVFNEGRPLYSMSVAIAPKRFRDLLDKQFKNGEVVGILDRTLRFVARIPDLGDRVGTLASAGWRNAISQSPTGITENKTLEGNQSITAYSVTRYGWTVGVAELDDTIAAPQKRIFFNTIVGFALFVAVSILLSLAIASRFASGIRQLALSARDLGHGQTVNVPTMPFAEANEIALALQDAAKDISNKAAAIAKHQSTLEQRVAERTQELENAIEKNRRTEALLRQSQKMDAIGQLTGGIAHDFNNMLAIIIGNLDMMHRRIQRGGQDIQPLLTMALGGAQRAASLTRRLLAFSRQQALEPAVIDINDMLGNMSDLLRGTLGEVIELEIVRAAGLWHGFVDVSQLEQAIVNLAVNSRDAMDGGGKLTIETFNAALDDAYSSENADIPAGQYVGIAVSDTGIGMDSATRERAFDPFFTTKEVGKGTGLGLSQVFGFIKQSGGHVKIYSERNEGTTVKLYLPRYHGLTQPEFLIKDDQQTVPLLGGHETILVVEDEESVRRMVVDALRDLGYTVTHAESGETAIKKLSTMNFVNLLITDVVMPGMNGRELANAATAQRPEIRVLYTTGYTRNAIVHGGKLDADVQFLAKPFTINQLARKVRRLLDADDPA